MPTNPLTSSLPTRVAVLNVENTSAVYLVEKVGNGCHRNKLSFAMTDDLDGMPIFVAVAEAKGFRAAGDRLYAAGPQSVVYSLA